MALTAQTYQFLSQQGLTRLIDASAGPDGPQGVVSYWLVPTGGWLSGQRVPHAAQTDLEDQGFETTSQEGIEYFLVPEESSNLPGRLSHYAQLTGVAELQNPPSGGVNRVRETINTSKATVDPEGVAKYVEDNDSYEEARQKATEEEERVNRQVSASPAREPSEGKLVIAEQADASDNSSKASSSSDKARGTKTSSETAVKSTGDTKA